MPKLPTIPQALTPFVGVVAVAFVLAVLYTAAPVAVILAIVTTMLAVASMSLRTFRGGGTRTRTPRRRVGWNLLGTVEVRATDPFLTFRAEQNEEGISVPVTPGQWSVHGRSTNTEGETPGMREVEVRVVRDVRWAMLDWEWSPMQEPVLPSSVGTSAQIGRVGLDTGSLRIHAGRKDRQRGIVRVQTGTADATCGVGVVRDTHGQVVAVVSRFG
ncbi:MAG TPA: hypothetical protein VIS06_16210 [Mycobacteriales bacterium]